jgi:hypothetical protein
METLDCKKIPVEMETILGEFAVSIILPATSTVFVWKFIFSIWKFGFIFSGSS